MATVYVIGANGATPLRTRIAQKLHAALEKHLPEKRLFLKSDSETRFVRLRPGTQAAAILGTTAMVGWTIIATAVLLMDSLGAGSARDQAARQQATYEARLNAMAADRDARAAEAHAAQERFNLAMAEVSGMQERLLSSEDRRRELETGIEVIQSTLRHAMQERDAARDETQRLVAEAEGTATDEIRGADAEELAATIAFLTDALEETAGEREKIAEAADMHQSQADELALELRLMEERNDRIFGQLEEAVTVSLEPLDDMFRAAGLQPDQIIEEVRRGYSGQGGPLLPIAMSTKGSGTPDPDALRANQILNRLDEANLYRIAVEKLPFGMPVQSSFRFTSGFGYRNDPKGAGRRMHEGTDFAASSGTPIYATADGTVVHAGWQSGYGRLIKIQHSFGLETRYAHLSQIRVNVGDRVSRGDRIGDMGNSGRSTGTHLHYEVRSGGAATNPMTYIRAAKDVF